MRASHEPDYHGRKSPRWKQVRARVLAASDICWLCGRGGADTVDHVIPLSKGGDPLDPSNLRPAHGKRQPWGCPGNFGRQNRPASLQPPTSRPW